MKKLITFAMIGALTLSNFGNVPFIKAEESADPVVVEINETTFPDARVRAAVEDKADTDHNGKLEQSEITALNYLYLYPFKDSDDYDGDDDNENPVKPEYYTPDDFKIDLKGIEYLTSLTDLTLNFGGGTDMTEGNVKHLTKVSNFDSVYSLTSLKKLAIYNADMSEVSFDKFPDLEKLTLYDLDCVKNMKITNGKLKSLWVEGGNALTALNLSKASALKTLVVQNNDSLSKITFAKKDAAITRIQYTGNKNLKKLNLNMLTNLKTLILDDPALTTVTITKCKKLSTLTINEAKKLKALDLGKNKNLKNFSAFDIAKISDFNLRKNNKLDFLWLEGKNVKTFRLGKNKITFLRINNTNLKNIDLSKVNKNTLKDLNISDNKKLKKINVRSFKNLESVTASKYTKVIKRKKTVVTN